MIPATRPRHGRSCARRSSTRSRTTTPRPNGSCAPRTPTSRPRPRCTRSSTSSWPARRNRDGHPGADGAPTSGGGRHSGPNDRFPDVPPHELNRSGRRAPASFSSSPKHENALHARARFARIFGPTVAGVELRAERRSGPVPRLKKRRLRFDPLRRHGWVRRERGSPSVLVPQRESRSCPSPCPAAGAIPR